MIVKYPNEILREKCEQVKRADDQLKQIIENLKNDLKEASNGIGLAAPQIGENLRVFAIQHSGHDHIHIYVNPQILEIFDKEKVYPQVYTEEEDIEEFYEGCLSFPGYYGTLSGLMAIVFQHEFDHLDGVLFIDHIEKDEGKIFKETKDGLQEVNIEVVIDDS
jgi:peptide deformylase